MRKTVEWRIGQTVKNRDYDSQRKAIDNEYIINTAIRIRSRRGQNGGSNNKTSKNRRQRFNIRLV